MIRTINFIFIERSTTIRSKSRCFLSSSCFWCGLYISPHMGLGQKIAKIRCQPLFQVLIKLKMFADRTKTSGLFCVQIIDLTPRKLFTKKNIFFGDCFSLSFLTSATWKGCASEFFLIKGAEMVETWWNTRRSSWLTIRTHKPVMLPVDFRLAFRAYLSPRFQVKKGEMQRRESIFIPRSVEISQCDEIHIVRHGWPYANYQLNVFPSDFWCAHHIPPQISILGPQMGPYRPTDNQYSSPNV